MGVDVHWLRVGVSANFKLGGKLPIKGELIVDPTDSKVVIKYDPPTHSVQLLKSYLRPVNWFLYMPKSLPEAQSTFLEIQMLYSRENVHNVHVEVSDLMILFTRYN